MHSDPNRRQIVERRSCNVFSSGPQHRWARQKARQWLKMGRTRCCGHRHRYLEEQWVKEWVKEWVKVMSETTSEEQCMKTSDKKGEGGNRQDCNNYIFGLNSKQKTIVLSNIWGKLVLWTRTPQVHITVLRQCTGHAAIKPRMHLKHAFVVKRIQASREQGSIDFFHHCGGRTLWLVLLRFDRVAAGSAGHWLPQLACTVGREWKRVKKNSGEKNEDVSGYKQRL